MPGLRPVAATVILLGLIWTFNMFNVIFLITGGGPANATQIFATFAYRAAFTDFAVDDVAARQGRVQALHGVRIHAVPPRSDL